MFLLALAGTFCFLKISLTALAETDSIIITEVRVSGAVTTTDEYIELFNPTNSAINLSGWKLIKKTAGGSTSTLVSDFGETTILPRHYFLITHNNYTDLAAADFHYTNLSSSIASDNTILIYDQTNNLIDKIGYGNAGDFSGTAAPNHAAGRVLKRELIDSGNYKNTGDNSLDFIIGESNPKNSSSTLIIEDDNNATSTPEENDNSTTTDETTDNNSTTTLESEPDLSIGDIVINEILTDPNTGEAEWLELYNNTDSPIELKDWKIKDNAQTSTIGSIASSTVINQFLTLEFHSRFNNSGDIAELIAPDETVFDRLIYGDYPGANLSALGKNQSLARPTDGDLNSAFKLTTTATKNLNNLITDPPIINSGAGTLNNQNTITTQVIIKNEITTTTIATSTYSGKIIFNEFFPNPKGSDTAGEFIELKNIASSTIDLNNWSLSDGLKKFILKNLTLEPGEIISLSRTQTNLVQPNNKAAKFFLYDQKNQTVNQAGYPSDIKESQSYALSSASDWKWTEITTPGEENIFSLENQPPLAEFDCEIEGNYAYCDASESTDPEGEVITYSWNFGDNHTSRLIQPKHKYDTPGEYLITLTVKDNKSLKSEASKNFKLEAVKKTASAGTVKNEITIKNNQTIDSLNALNGFKSNSTVKARGVVTALPGILGAQYFYIRDSACLPEEALCPGVQVYSQKKLFPHLSLGDQVEVSGAVSQISGINRIKTKIAEDIIILNKGLATNPEIVSFSELSDNDLGSLIKIAGTIVEASGANIFIDDGQSEMKVVLPKNINPKELSLSEGDKLEVTGILSKTTAGLRLQPREKSDLKITSPGQVLGTNTTASPKKIKNDYYYLAVIALLAILLIRFSYFSKPKGLGSSDK